MNPRADQNPASPAQPTPEALESSPALARRSRGATRRSLDLARLEAAASLLGDESLSVRRALSREFARSGRMGGAVLRRSMQSSDARVRSHARALLDNLSWEAARRRLVRFAAGEHADFEAGMWCISALERPNFDARPYRRALDAMAREVQKRGSGYRDPLDRAKVLVDYLGLELGYGGDLESYTSPDNVYLHRAIERKKGLPLTLCGLYSFVAQRCGLKTGLVPLPGHVMLRLYGRRENLIVDPFHGGEARSQESLTKYLAEHGLRFKSVWFRSADGDSLVRRQISNLRNSLLSVGRMDRAGGLSCVLDQFDER